MVFFPHNTGEFKVTLVIFSGVPNPVWWVHPRHEKFNEMKKLHQEARGRGKALRQEHIPATLGYRGFLVHHPEDEHAELILGQETTAYQKILLGSMPEGKIHDALHPKIRQAIDSRAVSPSHSRAVSPRHVRSILRDEKDVIQHYAPIYNPGRWNDVQLIQWNNNCYNYANQKITNSFAQPGRASGNPIVGDITADKTLRSAESDGLWKMDVPNHAPVPEAPPQPNCLVALVVAPGVDYHWYRLDNTGYWSHKPGPTPATNLDGDGNKITDPRKAANAKHGPDYQFVSFMQIYTNIIE